MSSAWFDFRSAASRVQAAEAALNATSQNLILRVVQAYLNVLRAQDRLEAAQAQETAVGRQLEQVQQRFEVGLVAITDVLEAQAAYDNSAVARIQAEGDLHVFFNALTTLTGEDYQSLDRLAEALPIITPAPADEQAWVDAALESNFNVLAARSQLEAANRNLAARRAAHLPTVDGSITHSYFHTGGLSFLGNKTETTTYALTMNLPIYQGGFTHSRRKEARALADQARDELLNQQLTVTRDARSLFPDRRHRRGSGGRPPKGHRLQPIGAGSHRNRLRRWAPATSSMCCRRSSGCTPPNSTTPTRATTT